MGGCAFSRVANFITRSRSVANVSVCDTFTFCKEKRVYINLLEASHRYISYIFDSALKQLERVKREAQVTA